MPMSSRAPLRSYEADDVIAGKYRVVRVLGAGGYGSVIEAENLRTTRRVAIKVVDGEALARSPTAAKRLRVEARATAKLSHPNSVAVLDLDEDADGSLLFVQEHLVGETLHARLEREKKLPWREAFSLMVPVMSALAEAHRKGIVHRDVKPENIFLSEAAPGVLVPKIIDFGIARVFDADELRLTQTDRVVGTPWYMSPEQAAGERDLDGQTDVWAVGVVLYECLTGSSPYTAGNIEVLMRAIATADLTPLRLRCPDVPASVASVIEGALVLDRSARYRTMGDFVDAALACMGTRTAGIGHVTALRPDARHEDPAPTNSDAPARTTTGEGTHSLTPSLLPPRASSAWRGAGLALAGMALTALAGFVLGSLANARPPPQVITAPLRLATAPVVTAPVVVAPVVAAPVVAAPVVAAPVVAAPVVAAPVVTAPVVDAPVLDRDHPRRRRRLR
jgi:eukaryotic-like serine/threonine-protein kinase